MILVTFLYFEPYISFEEFGFVAFDEKNNSVDFYWFYDQDNDLRIYDTASFDKFYNSYFSWLETE